MKVGPVNFNASASVGVEVNDNVGLSETDRQGDLILRPEIQLNSEWQVSKLNTLRFGIGIGYAAYTQHSDLDTRSILLDPGSQIAFDVYIGGVLKLTFHDRFAILQNPVDEPALSNTARFDRFQNAAGVTMLWDFNDLKIVAGYDYFTYRTFGDEFDFLDRSEEQLYASGSLRLSDAITTGIDASGALVNYRTGYNNNGKTWSAGPFVEATLSSYTQLRIAGGYQGMNFDDNGTSGDRSNYTGWYASLTAAQRLSQYWSHSISVGHEGRLGLTVNYSEYNYARYLAAWQLNPWMHVGFEGFIEGDNESGTVAQESELSRRWGGGASLGWRLGPKTTMDLRYNYVKKDSDLPDRSYYQNVGLLTLSYSF